MKLPATPNATLTSAMTSIAGLKVVRTSAKSEDTTPGIESPDSPQRPQSSVTVVPKPDRVIPHQGNMMLNSMRTPASTPRKFTLGNDDPLLSGMTALFLRFEEGKPVSNKWVVYLSYRLTGISCMKNPLTEHVMAA